MSELKRILCPIDFDAHSSRALARAQDLAVRHGAELRLVHVFPSRPVSIPLPLAGPAEEAERSAGAHLAAMAKMMRERGLSCDVATLHGDPAFQILRAARDGEVDLIVMATHGRKGVSRVVLGSVTEGVLHATPCPLLTIPPRAAGAGGSFRRVLCAVDLTPSSSATLSHALAMVEEAHSELTVVNVIDPAFSSRPPAAARAYTLDALERLHRRAFIAQGCVVRDAVRIGETATEILQLAMEYDAQLVVVGAHSRRPAVAAMVGSCADRIVRESPCPVLAVPSPTPALTIPVLHPVYA